MENKPIKCTCERPDDYACDYCEEQESKRILKEAKEGHAARETLEEASKIYAAKFTAYEQAVKVMLNSIYGAFMDGAKWQVERTCDHNYILTAEKGHRVIKCSTCNDTRPI